MIFRPALLSSIAALTFVVGLTISFTTLVTGRERVDIGQHPWTSVGKLSAFRHCTGIVVGEREILTAAHCVYNEVAGRFVSSGAVHFMLGYIGGRFRVERVASGLTVLPGFEPRSNTGDWAVLHVGNAFPPEIVPLRLAVDAPQEGAQVGVAGYNRGRLYAVTADSNCEIVSVSGALIRHNCTILHGDSGGPLLDRKDGNVVVGVNIGTTGKDGIAISAASISAALLHFTALQTSALVSPRSAITGRLNGAIGKTE